MPPAQQRICGTLQPVYPHPGFAYGTDAFRGCNSAMMIRARATCFSGRLRSARTAAKRWRSAAGTKGQTVWAMAQDIAHSRQNMNLPNASLH